MDKQWKRISGWGNYPVIKAQVIAPATIAEVQQAVTENPSLLARGNGRSYGDSSLHQVVLNTGKLHKIVSEGDDWIEVEAGITIAAVLKYIIPKKKFLPVIPGISSVTIGGAIASDVHGKNHLHAGSFFNVTTSLQLINEEGKLINCSRTENAGVFYSCFGGMGLQGIIVSAIIKLTPLPSSWIKEQQYVATSLKSLFSLMEANRRAPYLVAWIDLLGENLQGIVKTGKWLTLQELPDTILPYALTTRKAGRLPFLFPIAPPAFAFKWYNKRYLSKAVHHPSHLVHFSRFFHPLDNIKNWNYVFGPNGILQYHFRLPLHVAEEGITKIINTVKSSKAICTLAVIKIFGNANIETPYSFPHEGYNMALDFIHTKHAVALIRQLDIFVKQSGGSVYKTKDAISAVPSAIRITKFQSLQNERYGS